MSYDTFSIHEFDIIKFRDSSLEGRQELMRVVNNEFSTLQKMYNSNEAELRRLMLDSSGDPSTRESLINFRASLQKEIGKCRNAIAEMVNCQVKKEDEPSLISVATSIGGGHGVVNIRPSDQPFKKGVMTNGEITDKLNKLENDKQKEELKKLKVKLDELMKESKKSKSAEDDYSLIGIEMQ